MNVDRIYIFVPHVLKTSAGSMEMPCGRMAAQCAHVAAKLAKKFKDVHAMTTIILEVLDIEELYAAENFLSISGISFLEQRDTFPPAEEYLLQAVATVPITREQAKVFENYKRWSCSIRQ